MTNRESVRSRLQVLLHGQSECTGRLNQILNDETQALAARDVDAIERLLEEKRPLLHDLDRLDREVQELLAEAGFGKGKTGIEACIAWCDEPGMLSGTWKLLLERVGRAQRQNRINGVTLESSRSQAQRAVALLRGESCHAATYNPAGTTAGTNNGRVLAKA